MTKLKFTVEINATAAKVWQVLWTDSTYRIWTNAFHKGSYAVSDWKKGSEIQFLTPEGDGMYSVIADCRPKEYMSFKHLGIIKNFKEQPENEETQKWGEAMENYILKEENGTTMLQVDLDAIEQYLDYFNKTFPKALDQVKTMAEQPLTITVETSIAVPIEKIWEHWTLPKHIVKWNNASDDWHTPRAENDLQVGGKFNFHMAARDGSMGFDFNGTYTAVDLNKKIEYTIADGRHVKVEFIKHGKSYKIIETFEAEEMNTLELQRKGWQAIMDNFKKYTESNA